MKLPSMFTKVNVDSPLHESYISNGLLQCPKTGFYYNPVSGRLTGHQSTFREIESKSKYAKIQIIAFETKDFVEMNATDLIWEIMTGEEPTGTVTVKSGLYKVCLQWINIEMELPDFQAQINFFESLENIKRLNIPFKCPKEQKKFLKQVKVVGATFVEIFGGMPKKFISGVDYLKNLNEIRGNRKTKKSNWSEGVTN